MSLAIDFPHDISEVAQALNLSETFIRQQVRRGAIAHYRFGRRIKVYTSDVLDYLARSYVPCRPQTDDEMFQMLISGKETTNVP